MAAGRSSAESGVAASSTASLLSRRLTTLPSAVPIQPATMLTSGSATTAGVASGSEVHAHIAGSGTDPWISGGVLSVLVLGVLCLILGLIYAYIYFTRINPRAANRAARKYVSRQLPPSSDDGSQQTSTHLFLFKKS